MTTIVNSPTPSGESSGMGFVMGMILLVVFVAFVIFWGIPALQNSNLQPVAPSINVPDKIDINVNQPDTQQPSQ